MITLDRPLRPEEVDELAKVKNREAIEQAARVMANLRLYALQCSIQRRFDRCCHR